MTSTFLQKYHRYIYFVTTYTILYYKMIDIVNVQLYGFPVFMYAMILVTTGAITYATVYSDQLPSLSPLPSFPTANPSGSNSIPGMPNMGGPPAPPAALSSSSASSTGPQGGKHKSKKTKHHRPSKKTHSHSSKNTKPRIKIH